MLFGSIVDLNSKFEFLQKLTNGFYQIDTDITGFTYKANSGHLFSLEDIKTLYSLRKFKPTKHDFNCLFEYITQDMLFEKTDEFCRSYGAPDDYNIQYTPNAPLTLECAEKIKNEIINFLKTNNFTCIELRADMKSYFHPMLPWGICVVLLNEQNSIGMMIYLDPAV